MKYLNSSILRWTRCMTVVTTFILTIVSLNFSYSQCSLACNGNTQVSLDIYCEAEITPEMILNDQSTSCPDGDFIVDVYTEFNDIPSSPVVTGAYMNQTIIAEVIDQESGNSCWGYIIIEDKLGPNIDFCPQGPIEIPCIDLASAEPTFVDACEGPVDAILLSENITPLGCDDNYIKVITRVYTAVDSKGFYAPQCTIEYKLLRFDFDNVVCPDNYTIYDDNALSCDGEWKEGQGGHTPDTDTDYDGEYDLDVYWDDNMNGYPDPEEVGVPEMVINNIYNTLIPSETLPLYPYPDVYCNSAVTYTDIELPQVGCSRKIMRSWIIWEWHCNGEVTDTCLQILEITDEEAPVVTCNPSIQITTNTFTSPNNSHYGDVTCGASVILPLPDATDNCSTNLSYDVLYPGGFVKNYDGQSPIVIPMGVNEVTFTVYDECYNSETCDVIVEVVDNTPPVAICDQYTVASLTTGGEAKVNATSFDDGSYDDCKTHCMLVRRMDTGSCNCHIPTFCNMDYIGEYNGSYYYLSNYEISASIAKSRAAAYGGSLAIFETYYEESWLVNEIRKNNTYPFWIGLKTFGGGYLWDDHTPVTYYNWGAYEPSGKYGEDCVYIGEYDKWYDGYCGAERRYVLEIKDICGFSETATFCCSDVGNDNMVVFRVVDIFGNYNDCMVNVDIQDKIAPTLICPPHEYVHCDTPYDPDNLAFQFGEATVLDDCGATVTETLDDRLDQCNIGELIRIFTATDNGGRTSTCKQILTFDNPDPFDGDNIVCPEDHYVVGCMAPEELGPDVLGYPEYPGDHCDLVGSDWDDEVFTFNNFNGQACFKILRTWEIIDWCQQDPYTGQFPIWTCQQVIKISNDIRPEISACDSIEVCTYDSACATGYVELSATATDDCTENENLRWRYKIYTGDVGVGPHSLTGTPYVEYTGVGDSINASGNYPVGSHVIQWTFYDKCGNANTCNQAFTIMNCKAATAYCISGLAVDLMPIDSDNDGEADFGMVELWASDFDAGSSHPCGYDVFLSFSPDTSERNKVFDCTTRGDQEVEIWVSVEGPNGDLIQTYCETFVNVQDNMGACVGQSDVRVDVDGTIFTEQLETVTNVQVDLDGSELSTNTDIDGGYAFANMPTGGDYMVNPFSNDSPLNGVSTLDIIEIQKHILGIERLNSAYKIIAADVNNDKELSAKDLIDLRKVVLGIYNDFPNNDSWRFVDKDYVFQDTEDPFNEKFTEDYEIINLNSDMNIDFIAVKVGDVNNTAQINADAQNELRSAQNFEFSYELGAVNQGDLVTIPVTSVSEGAKGFQFTMDYNADMLEILSLEGGEVYFDENNYRILPDGKILISWNNTIPLDKGTEVFNIVARAKSDQSSENVFNISSSLLRSEAYSSNDILKPVINNTMVPEEIVESSFELYQNTPNPFTNSTQIQFNLVEDENVTMSIHNVHGQLVKSYSGFYNQGLNTFTMNAKDIGASGVLYLTLQTEQNTASIKMVVLR